MQVLGAELLYSNGEYDDLFKWCEERDGGRGFYLWYGDYMFFHYKDRVITIFNKFSFDIDKSIHNFFYKKGVPIGFPNKFKYLKTLTENQKLRMLEHIANFICNSLEDIRKICEK